MRGPRQKKMEDTKNSLPVKMNLADLIMSQGFTEEAGQTLLEILEKAPYGIVLVDRDGNYLYVNPECTKTTGYTQEDTPNGKKWFRHAYPDSVYRREVLEAWREDRAKGAVANREYRVFCKNGETKYIQFRSTFLNDGRAITTLHDVTEQKKAERELLEHQKFLEMIMGQTVDGIVFYDEGGKVRFANKAAQEMGLVGHEKPVVSIMPEMWYKSGDAKEETGPWAELFLKKALAGKTFLAEKARVTREGEHCDVIFSAGPIRGLDDKVIGVVATFTDVTRLRLAEEALKKSEEEKSIILNSMTDLVAYQDLDMRVVWANNAAAKSVGLRNEDLLGRRCYEVWHSRKKPCRRCPVRKARITGKVIEAETASADGRNWQIKGYPIKDSAGRVVGVVEVTTDITERKRAEQEIRDLNRMLESHVSQLQKINEGLETASYSLSHDLKSPLIALEGFSRILMEKYTEGLDGRGKQLLERLHDIAGHTAGLVQDLIAFFSIGRRPLKYTLVDMKNLAFDILDEIKIVYPHRRIQLNVLDVPQAWADHAMTRQVLTNLFTNAAKYGKPEGKIIITVGGYTEENINTYFVKDNGVGFSMEQAGEIFEKFHRLKSSTGITGTGIGLTIVKRIIKLHEGEIWAEGEEGKGATFYFTLPARGTKSKR